MKNLTLYSRALVLLLTLSGAAAAHANVIYDYSATCTYQYDGTGICTVGQQLTGFVEFSSALPKTSYVATDVVHLEFTLPGSGWQYQWTVPNLFDFFLFDPGAQYLAFKWGAAVTGPAGAQNGSVVFAASAPQKSTICVVTLACDLLIPGALQQFTSANFTATLRGSVPEPATFGLLGLGLLGLGFARQRKA